MANAKISEWSQTAGSNTEIDGISLAEGVMTPSLVNNAIREQMSQVAEMYAGASGDRWPVTAGGTGSTSAAGARTNLSVPSITQTQDSALIWCGTAGGTADALTLTPAPAITAYAAGQAFRFTAGASPNTGATTVAISGLTAKAIQNAGAALAAGEIAAGRQYEILYDGTQFQLQAYALGGAGGAIDVQTFTSSGTWNKPSGATMVMVEGWGAGGAGGSGRRGAAGSDRYGGGGGGGGAFNRFIFAASALGSTETVTIGAGGTGGTAITANDTDGNNGTTGGNSTFGSHATFYGGGLGSGGSATDGQGGGGGGTNGPGGTTYQSLARTGGPPTPDVGSGNIETAFGGGFGSTSGGSGATSSGFGGGGGGDGRGNTNGQGGASSNGGGGGGGGGRIDAANTTTSGQAGGGFFGTRLAPGGGGAGGGSGANGSAGATARMGGGGGGGGGAGAGGSGAAGTAPGGGGGGGGASLNGNNSGAGGNGARGEIRVYSW